MICDATVTPGKAAGPAVVSAVFCATLFCAVWSDLLSPQVQAADSVDYARQIRPLLQERCYACHGALKQEGGLRLDTVALAITGGDSGAALEPRNPAGSLLLQRVSAADPADRMPPEGEPLKPEQRQLLETWIAQGAVAPPDEQPEADPREHWAFRSPVRPAVPVVADAAWNQNPIDAFLAREHEQRGLQRQPPAPRRILLRRLYLDLTGLPPTAAQQAAFLADDSPEAVSRVVDQLLASPQYGERWGRHWMDVWRYSDWWGLGAEVRNSQKHIWHWRDWIIESLNADKGYDQMLREMLAADELYPNDLDRLRATGFLARQYFKFNRTTWLDGTIEHTAKAMLGMTFNCSKCHDHKYDPISQQDYYRLRAVFEPYQLRTELIPGELDPERNGIPRAFDCNLDVPTFVHLRGDDRNPDQSQQMQPGIPDVLQFDDWQIQAVTLPPEAVQPGLRAHILAGHLQAAERRIGEARTTLQQAETQLQELQRASSETNTAESTAAAAEGAESELVIGEKFAAVDADVWEAVTGQWTVADDGVRQEQTTAVQSALRLRRPVPRDFEADLQFTITGGQMWKSVGMIFDEAGPAENLVYLSAVAGGSKVQASWTTDGRHAYPAEAAQPRPVPLQMRQQLTVRVRDTLVNVLVNGELAIAWRLPVPRRTGTLKLITFDAQATLHRFSLRVLPEGAMLAEARSGIQPSLAPVTLQQAQLAVDAAAATLAAAEAEPAALRARAAAEAARWQQPPADNVTALATAAAQAERQQALVAARAELKRAERDLALAAADKQADAQKRLTAAQTQVQQAETAAAAPGENYTALTGALKTLESNLETEDSRRKPFPQLSSGRRSAFARWLTDTRNPLTARVAVNHIWLRHFGRPLVPTVFDFGRKGTPPTHPELLDWLAVELMENDWSMKHVHRLLLTSQAWQLSSSARGAAEATLQQDAGNQFYWRANSTRMEAQAVRDALLHLAGELDLTSGGPSIPVRDDSSRRRSLYYVHSHNEHQPFLAMFDDANVLDCYRRSESIVPQQALALENSPLAADMASRIAERILADRPEMSAGEFVTQAFVLILSAEPTPEELGVATSSLAELQALATASGRPQPAQFARQQLVQALLNHNDFVTIR